MSFYVSRFTFHVSRSALMYRIQQEIMNVPERILIVKLGSVGDIVHTLPAVAALRKRYPAARIDWIVEARSRAILEDSPVIDHLIEVDTKRWRAALAASATRREIFGAVKQLRRTGYDVAIDFQGLFKSAVIAFASGARRRIGFDKAHLREPGARIFYTQRVRVAHDGGPAHVIALNNALVEPLGVKVETLRFPFSVAEGDAVYVDEQLRKHDLEKFVIINPGGGWPTKLWSPEKYAELSEKIYQSLGLRSVITASAAEAPLLERMCLKRAHGVFFPTTLKQLIPLMKRAVCFIGGDSGPLHMAAAVGTPIVGIYGPTTGSRNGPFHPSDLMVCRKELPCLGCWKRTCPLGTTACMDISTDAVLAAVKFRVSSFEFRV
jgi:lipopolysaccharide heptosyltransferase I